MPASTCFEGHLDRDGNRIENYYDFDAQGTITVYSNWDYHV